MGWLPGTAPANIMAMKEPHVSQAALSPSQPQDGEACIRKCLWDILVGGWTCAGRGHGEGSVGAERRGKVGSTGAGPGGERP